MSTHDRGTFGQLLAEAKELGATRIRWDVHLDRADDDVTRWVALSVDRATHADFHHGTGRTGEEALRRLVEKLRVK